MVDIPVGNSVRVCGCVGLIDDTNLESSETFNIAATINDPIMTSSAPLSTVVLVQDDPTDSKKTRKLSFAPLTFSVCVFLPHKISGSGSYREVSLPQRIPDR